jgi:Mn-dependent DtxR family transcriptional regulator
MTVVTAPYTKKQGQYLAFIRDYTKVNGQPPAEADIQCYFQVTPPSVHSMVVRLEQEGFIARTPRTARSIRLLVPHEQIPTLR